MSCMRFLAYLPGYPMNNKIIKVFLITSVFFLVDLFMRSFSVGLPYFGGLTFSFRHIFTPLLGYFGGFIPACLFFVAKTAFHGLHTSLTMLALSIWHIPTLCGMIYLATFNRPSWSSKAYGIILPVYCMVIFWLHPVGRIAFLYPLYWVIPVLGVYFGEKSLFIRMLGTTFTTHAVGSIIWLYSGLLAEPSAWNTLIPIVACERFGFACIMTGVVYAVSAVIPWIQNSVWSKQLNAFFRH